MIVGGMGVARVIAEVQRLRGQLAEAEQQLAARDEALAERERLLAERQEQIEALTASNEHLARILEMMRLKRQGPKSERYVDDGQVPLAFVGQTPDPPPRLPKAEEPAPPEEPAPSEAPDRPKRRAGPRGPRRRDLSERDDLRTRSLRCRAVTESACGRCGGDLRVIGEDRSWRLDWVPGHFERIEVLRERCACPACPSEGVLTAPEPAFALRKALCGNGLLATVLVDKFADHVPLHRQARRMARQGVEIATSTLCGWVAAAATLLEPVADAVQDRLMASTWLQGDDTGFPVQDGADGKLRNGRLWVLTDQIEVLYAFTDTKHGEHPAKLLEDFSGELLLCDGGSEFNQVVRECGVVRAGCWSHLRRYFYEARHHHPNEAHLALGTIRDLFEIEAAIWRAERETRAEVRQRDARPLVEGLFRWIDQLSLTVRPSSKLGEAIGYARNGRATFTAFLDHPEVPMHNNLSELQLRQGVVGRKNWLFAGSAGGAEAAATVYTLIGSCMLQGIDPWVYLSHVLNVLPDWPAKRVHELTPYHWRLARERAVGAKSDAPTP